MRRVGVFRSRYKRDSSSVTVPTGNNSGIIIGSIIIAIFVILAILPMLLLQSLAIILMMSIQNI